jgi:phosphoesterase RecJ-like protein
MTQALNELQRHLSLTQSALLIAHVSPDGDTIGSTLGLAGALRRLGLRVRVACADPVPENLRFLPGAKSFKRHKPHSDDLLIAVDCSDPSRTGDLYDAALFASRPVVVIDHHITNPGWGTINLVDADAVATAQLVLRLIEHLGIPLDVPMATCLLTGLITDTLGFRTNNTTAQALRDASILTEAGAPLAEIMDQVYGHNPLALLRLWGFAFSHAELQEGVLWVELSQEDMSACGANAGTASGLVNFLSTIDEATVALVVREMGGGRIDVSLRSRPSVDVSLVATALGGGGHPQAAGCQLSTSLSEARQLVLAAIHEQMPQPVA